MRVAVFGDLNVDVLLKVPKLPEGDISLAADEFRVASGGVGGNVATALRRLGTEVTLVSAVGRDALGKYLLEDLREEGVGTEYVRVVDGVPTGIMVVFILEGGLKTIVGGRGANSRVSLTQAELESLGNSIDFAHFSGYLSLNDDGGEFLRRALNVLKRLGVNISVDLEGVATQQRKVLGDLRGLPDYVFLNADELRILTRGSGLEGGGRELLKYLRAKAVFVKLGSRGSAVITSDGRVVGVPPFKVSRVVDTTGAGDGFNAGAIFGLLRGLKPPEAARVGNALGAYVCSGLGARHLPKDLRDLLSTYPELLDLL